jgi:hypothetical protein
MVGTRYVVKETSQKKKKTNESVVAERIEKTVIKKNWT